MKITKAFVLEYAATDADGTLYHDVLGVYDNIEEAKAEMDRLYEDDTDERYESSYSKELFEKHDTWAIYSDKYGQKKEYQIISF